MNANGTVYWGADAPADIFAEGMAHYIGMGMDTDKALARMQGDLRDNLVAYVHELIRANSKDENFAAYVKILKARVALRVLDEIVLEEINYVGMEDMKLLGRTLRDWRPTVIAEPHAVSAAFESEEGEVTVTATTKLPVHAAARLHSLLAELSVESIDDLEEPPDNVVELPTG